MPSVDEAWRAAYAAASRAWPSFRVTPERFRAYVAERSDDFAAALASPHLADLYLACACAGGDERALAAFRDTLEPALRHAVARAVPAYLADEMVQVVMAKLFVGDGSKPPAIAQFNGAGKLSTWIQVVARRTARTGLRGENRRGGQLVDSDEIDSLLQHAMRDEAPALRALKQSYRDRFKAAFRAAFEQLSPRDRNMLRYECLDGLNRDQIAHLLGVSRATVARYRAACREQLFAETRKAFSRDLQVETEEFKSLMQLIESQLDVSLTRLLRSE